MAAADALNGSQIAESIAQLAKAIESSNAKIVSKLEKLVGTSTVQKANDAVTEEDDIKRKKGKVLEDVINVKVTQFGDKALNQLTKVLKGLIPKPKAEVAEKKVEDNSFLKKLLALAPLLLPLVALALKFLSGLSGDKLFEFLANLFPKLFDIGKLAEGALDLIKGLWNVIKGGFKLFKETKLGKFISELGDDIAKLFKENKLFQKIFGEAGIFSKVFGKAGFFAKIFGEGSTFAKLFDTAGDAAKILTGGFFGKIFKGIGKTVLKRLPLLGSIFSFYDAYQELSSGDYLSGFTSLLSGIANLFPGVGSVISIGLDFLNYLFKTESMQDFKANLNQGLFTQAFSSLGDTLVQKMPFLKWFYDLAENIGGAVTGDKDSIIALFDQFGLKSLAEWMYNNESTRAYIGGLVLDFGKLVYQAFTQPFDTFIPMLKDMVVNALADATKAIKEKFKSFFGFGADKESEDLTKKLEDKLNQKKREKEQLKDITPEPEQLNDFTSEGSTENIIKRGDVIKKFSKDDNIFGFKAGGDIEKTIKSIVKHLETVSNNSSDMLKAANEQINALQALLEKTNANIINNPVNNNTYVMTPSSSVESFRAGALGY